MKNTNKYNSQLKSNKDNTLSQCFSAYDIVEKHLTEINEIANSIGINFVDSYRNIQFPCRLNGSQVVASEKEFQGKIGIIAEIRIARNGLQYPFFVFRTFRNSGETITWSGYEAAKSLATGNKLSLLSDKEREAVVAQREIAKEKREAQQQSEREAKKAYSLKQWTGFERLTKGDSDRLIYLNRKQILPILDVVDLRFGKDKTLGEFIAHPLFAWNGDQVGYERISIADSSKKAVSAGANADGIYVGFINGDTSKPAYVTEGFADAASIHLATNACVFVAISASNIKKICELLTEDGIDFVVASDNDKAGDKSVFDCQCDVAFARAPKGGKDWNDYHVGHGLEAVKKRLEDLTRMSTRQIVDRQYLGNVIRPNCVNLVKGEKGTGKTTSLNDIIDKHESCLVITYRRSLATKIAEDCNMQNYQDIVINQEFNMHNYLVISPESLPHIDCSRKFDCIIIDESEQTIGHGLTSSTMKKKRMSHTWMRNLCANAKTVVLMDADLGNASLAFTRSFNAHSDLPLSFIENEYKPRAVNKHKIYIYPTADQVIGMASKYEDKAFCFSDSKAVANQLFAARNSKGLLITSETINDVQEQLLDINNYVKTINTVVGSPSFGTGVSVDEGHGFEIGFGVLKGRTASVEQCLQQFARFRGLGEYHISLGSNADGANPTTAKDVEKLLITGAIKADIDFGLELDNELDDFSKIWCEVKADLYKSTNSFSTYFVRKAKEEGFEVIFVNEDEEMKTLGAEIASEVKAEAKELKKIKIGEEAVKYEDLGFTDNEAQRLAELDSSKKIINKILKTVHVASISNNLANQVDKTEYQQVKDGHLAQCQLSHTSAKRKLVIEILDRVGVSYDKENRAFVSDGTVWNSKKAKIVANWLKKNEDRLLVHLNISKKRSTEKESNKNFNMVLASVGIVVKTKRISSKSREFSVDIDALVLVNKVLANKSIFEEMKCH